MSKTYPTNWTHTPKTRWSTQYIRTYSKHKKVRILADPQATKRRAGYNRTHSKQELRKEVQYV